MPTIFGAIVYLHIKPSEELCCKADEALFNYTVGTFVNILEAKLRHRRLTVACQRRQYGQMTILLE